MKATLCDICQNPIYNAPKAGALYYRIVVPKLYRVTVEEYVDIPKQLDLCSRCSTSAFEYARKRRNDNEI